jgi:hypothetical protein
MIGPLSGPWLPAVAALLLALAARRVAHPPRAEWWLLALLVAGAALARGLFGLWGPLHNNGQAPLWVLGALDASVLSGSYGPGYFEMLSWPARLAPADRSVFAANLALSALSPALLYATARLVGVAAGGALAAAVLLAADPVLVRTAASEGYYSPILALLLGVYLALAGSLRAAVRGDRSAQRLALAAAGLFAAATARVHPMSYLPLALTPLLVLSSVQPERWGQRILRSAAAAALIGGVVLLTSGAAILVALRSPIAGSAIGLPPGDQWQALAVAFAAALLLHRWARPPWLPMLGVASLLGLLATQTSFTQHPVWQLVYQRLFWPGLLLGLAPLLPRPRRAGAAVGLAAAAAAATAVWLALWPALRAPTTDQLEYAFLRDALRAMPPDCTLAAVSRVDKRHWVIPSFLAPGQGAQRAVESAADLAAAPGACFLYVRSSLCSSVEGRATCDAIERDAALEPLARQSFPAAPSFLGLPYDRDVVETVLFRVTAHRLGVNDGIAITPDFAAALYARISPLREADGCRLASFTTSRFRVTAALVTPSGAAHAVEFATAPPGAASTWAVVASGEAEQACGATLASLRRVLDEIGAPAPAAATEPTG